MLGFVSENLLLTAVWRIDYREARREIGKSVSYKTCSVVPVRG